MIELEAKSALCCCVLWRMHKLCMHRRISRPNWQVEVCTYDALKDDKWWLKLAIFRFLLKRALLHDERRRRKKIIISLKESRAEGAQREKVAFKVIFTSWDGAWKLIFNILFAFFFVDDYQLSSRRPLQFLPQLGQLIFYDCAAALAVSRWGLSWWSPQTQWWAARSAREP